MIDQGEMSLMARYSRPSVIRTDTNTIVLDLSQDEALAFIAELAQAATFGDSHIIIELDKITYPKAVF